MFSLSPRVESRKPYIGKSTKKKLKRTNELKKILFSCVYKKDGKVQSISTAYEIH